MIPENWLKLGQKWQGFIRTNEWTDEYLVKCNKICKLLLIANVKLGKMGKFENYSSYKSKI